MWKKGLFLFAILLLPSLVYLFLATGKHNFIRLPYFGPREAIQTNQKGSPVTDTIYHQIPPFSFTNQHGETVTHKDFEGTIYVADFFFTTCKSICPKMSSEFTRIQEKTVDLKNVKLISFTVDPEHDSVPVLRDYAEQMRARKGIWHLVTGEKTALYDLARNGFFVTALEGDGGPDDFIHSEKFLLIDSEGHIRGIYDGTNRKEVDRLIDEIKLLRAEELIPKKER